MPPGRLILMLVVLSATLAVHRPASAAASRPTAGVERSSWASRLGSGVVRGFSRIGLMQRVTLRVPTAARGHADAHAVRPVPARPDPRLTCLPPPLV